MHRHQRCSSQRDVRRARARSNTQVDASRTITVEFDANARGPLGVQAGAEQSVDVHPGEVTTVMYEFRNVQRPHDVGAGHSELRAERRPPRTSTSSSASASTSRRSTPGETKRWPVVFVIDPKLPKDVKTITLSYTFFEVGGAEAGGAERQRDLSVQGKNDGRSRQAARAWKGRIEDEFSDVAQGGRLVVLRRAQAAPTWKAMPPS